MNKSFSEIIKKGLYGFSRTGAGRGLFTWLVGNMSFAIPINRLKETTTLVAFRHPSPDYPFHVLLVPKRKIASLMDLSDEDQPFLIDVFSTVQELVKSHHLEEAGYRLIVNGGRNQEFGILHYHLISDKEFNKTD